MRSVRLLLALAILIPAAPGVFADCSWTYPSSTSIMYSSNCNFVGLGTTSPDHPLHIKGSNPSIRVEDTNVTGSQLLLGVNSSAGTYLATDTNADDHATRAGGAHRITMGYTGINFEHGSEESIGDPRTWTGGLHYDSAQLNLTNPDNFFHTIRQTVYGSSRAQRLQYFCTNVAGWTFNQSYNCSAFTLDDTGYAGWMMAVNDQYGYQSGDYFVISRTPPGSNTHTDDVTLLKLEADGDLLVHGSVTASGVDLAEWVPASAPLRPGTVVVLDPDRLNQVMESTRAYDPTVAGVVSERPGVILGEKREDREMIASIGRVKVRVDATKNPIRVGDLLVTSDKPGVAMRSMPVDIGGVSIHRPGTLIGKALEPIAGKEGEILVLIALQ